MGGLQWDVVGHVHIAVCVGECTCVWISASAVHTCMRACAYAVVHTHVHMDMLVHVYVCRCPCVSMCMWAKIILDVFLLCF